MSPMPSRPDFRLYHSNALDVLAGLLAQELRAPAPGQALLAPDVVLIPQVAMRRWLQGGSTGLGPDTCSHCDCDCHEAFEK